MILRWLLNGCIYVTRDSPLASRRLHLRDLELEDLGCLRKRLISSSEWRGHKTTSGENLGNTSDNSAAFESLRVPAARSSESWQRKFISKASFKAWEGRKQPAERKRAPAALAAGASDDRRHHYQQWRQRRRHCAEKEEPKGRDGATYVTDL